MPYLNRGNPRLYYEDKGAGEPVIAVAGLMENTASFTSPVPGFWSMRISAT
ncbi:MAG: hypothetical protein R6U41_13415 [Desulfosalsimonas sp.]|uniref:hypothetical protein n=1 Tax=Desulfosalsimonas sp. TaxID=3073848 RepID=UPI003970A883